VLPAIRAQAAIARENVMLVRTLGLTAHLLRLTFLDRDIANRSSQPQLPRMPRNIKNCVSAHDSKHSSLVEHIGSGRGPVPVFPLLLGGYNVNAVSEIYKGVHER
jgi:hypothetical protein